MEFRQKAMRMSNRMAHHAIRLVQGFSQYCAKTLHQNNAWNAGKPWLSRLSALFSTH